MLILRPHFLALMFGATFLLLSPNEGMAQNARASLKEAEQEKKRIKALITDLSDDIAVIESDLQTVENRFSH